MENNTHLLKHDIFVGYMNGGELTEAFNIGHALKEADHDYYVVKLWPLPGTTYYLARNMSNDRYTIFSRKIVTENGVNFQNPVGYAVMRPEAKEYVEISLRFPKQRVYMSIFPAR